MEGNDSPLECDKNVYAYVNEGGETHIPTVGETLQEVSYAEIFFKLDLISIRSTCIQNQGCTQWLACIDTSTLILAQTWRQKSSSKLCGR